MGNLKPSATYTYEHQDGVVYATESGTTDKKVIGWDYKFDPRTGDGRPLREHILEDKMWGDIRRMALTNPALQKALDRAIMLYHLSKENGKK